MQINLLVVCDRNYLKHAITALTSACEHNTGDALRIFLIHTGLDQTDMESARIHLQRYNATIRFLQPQQNFVGDFHVHRHISSATYLRLLCGALLPQEVDRVLYLDCDVIVASALKELFTTDLGNCTIAAVRDAYIGTHRLPTHLDMLPTVKMDYFNSGVMLIDLVRYRMARTGIQALELAKRHSRKFTYLDQDALNIALRGRWKPLHPKWNVQSFWYNPPQPGSFEAEDDGSLTEALLNPAIIHYTTFSKPWNPENTHPQKAQYWKYRQLTPWPELD